MPKQHVSPGFWLLLWVCCFQACRPVPQKVLSMDACLVPSLDFEYLKIGATVAYQDREHYQSHAYINFRIKKGSLIWFSVSGLWGIEILRGIITPMGITLVNHMQKACYVYDYATLCALWPGPWDYALLQALLLGELPPDASALQEVVQQNAQQIALQYHKEAWTLTYCIHPALRKVEKLVATAMPGSFVVIYNLLKPRRGGSLFRRATLHWYCRTAPTQPTTTLTLKNMKVQWPKKPLRFPCLIPAQYEKK